MNTRRIAPGSTSQSVVVRFADSTTGLPLTGLTFGSAGLALSYRRTGAAVASITPVTQTASGAWASGGFAELSNGDYRVDVPDAAFVAGVADVKIAGTVTGGVMFGPAVELQYTFNESASAGILDEGVPQAVGSGTTTLRAATPFSADDSPNGRGIMVYGSTQGYWQGPEPITDYVNSTKVATHTAFAVTPTGTLAYKIVASPAPAAGGGSVNVASFDAGAITTAAFADGAITNAKVADGVLTAAKLASDTITAAKVATGTITAAKFAANAVDAAALATDAVTEITGAVTAALDAAVVDVNVKNINDIPVIGAGTGGNLWRA